MRFWPRSIRWQMIISLVALEALSTGLFALFLIRQQGSQGHIRAEQWLSYEATTMAVQAREALIQQRPGWVGLSVKMMGGGPTIAVAKVTDPAGNVLFISSGEPDQIPLTREELAQIPLVRGDEPRAFTFGGNRWEAVHAIYTGDDLRGYAWIEFDKSWAHSQTHLILVDTAAFGVIWGTASALLILLFSSTITRPLRILHRGTRELMRSPEGVSSFPLPVNVHNEVGELIEAFNGMVASIDEQRAGLNDTLSLLDSMLANAPIGLAFFDRDCRFVRINQVFADMTGVPLSRHLGRTIPELLPLPIASQLESAVLRVFAERQAVRNLEFSGRESKSGMLWTWLASAYPVLTLPQRVRWAGVIVLDTTDRKRAEDALRKAEKLAVTGRLAASIAHEINNPLEAITNLLFLLRNFCQLKDPALNYVNMAEYEVRRISEITQQTLRFYRQSTLPTRICLSELLGSVLSLYHGRFNAMNIQVESGFDPEIELFCFAGEIRQVFANLVGNAIDAVPNGGRIVVRAHRSCHWSEPALKGVRFTVADNGSGMEHDVMQHAFEAFYTTKEVTGTGLGLWISQEIVDKHNGFIHVRSCAGVGNRPSGTVFQFFIPDLPEPPAAPDPAAQS
ncbi:MAG: ATP-binding protein [Terracidiphilus sp.]|nr:ATP-binding protein [Terracidiphilus sp.]